LECILGLWWELQIANCKLDWARVVSHWMNNLKWW
jgi:hypothetical protein